MNDWIVPPINGAFGINKQSPQYRNLVFWFSGCLSPSRRPVNLVRNELSSSDIGAGGSIGTVPRFGYGVNFSGVNPQQVRFARYPAIEPAGTYFTISTWVYISSAFSSGAFGVLMGKSWNAHGSPTFTSYALYYNTNGRITFFTGHTGTIDDLKGIADFDLLTGQLVHIVGRMGPAASNNKQIYVNGLFDSQKTRAPDVIYDTDSGGDLTIGTTLKATPTDLAANITVLDARIYNRYLSDAEIWHMYAPTTRFDLYKSKNIRAPVRIIIGPSSTEDIYNVPTLDRVYNVPTLDRVYEVPG